MKKRLLSLFLIFCCLISCLPVHALASEVELPNKTAPGMVIHSSSYWVNPDFPGAEESIKNSLPAYEPQVSTNSGDAATYVTRTKAVAALRQAMVNRETTVTLYVSVSDSGMSDLSTYGHGLVSSAYEHTGKPKEGDYIFRHLKGYSFSWSYYPDTNEVTFTFYPSYLTTASQEAEMDTAVAKLLSKLNVSSLSDYQIVCAVYDYICANISYDYVNVNSDEYGIWYSAYGGLIQNCCVCQGYSSLFYRLMLECGIDARYIRGYASGGNHGWNIVRMGDKYFNIDSTWDAERFQSGYSYAYFLKSQDEFPGHTRRSEYSTTAFNTAYPMSEVSYMPLVITQQPTHQYAANGEKISATVNASGAYVTYQWYVKKAGASSYVKSSVTQNTYSVTMSESVADRLLYCKVTDIFGNSLTTNTIKFRMNASILTQPTNAAAPSGSTATVSLKAGGVGLTYKWYYKNPGDSSFCYTSSYTGDTYSVTMSSARSGRQVYCIVTDQYGNSVKSKTVTLYMGRPAKITTQPTNAAAPSGSTATVTLKATGDGLTYKWYFKNSGSSSFSYTSSFSGNSYYVDMNSSRNGRQVYCVVTDKYGTSVKSNTVTLYMGKPAKITTQPKSTTVAYGADATVTVKASGDGLTYKWYFKDVGDSKFTYTKSFTGNTYKVSMNAARDGRKVYCVITDKYGTSVKTSTVTISMTKVTLKITTQPTNVTVASGADAATTVTAQGNGLTYTWYVMDIGDTKWTKSSITSSTYSCPMNSTRAGRHAYCVVTDCYGNTVSSKVVTLNMKSAVSITTQPKSTTVAVGSTASAKVVASGTGLTYTWYVRDRGSNWVKSSITSATYSFTMTAAKAGRQAYCVVTDKYGNKVATNIINFKVS